ncbi:MAG: hypothetical protein HOQ24_10940 [Mycobacteriaceae bacterium]|nr:hypothetical protein [Mycobacteriaceae bacterium]
MAIDQAFLVSADSDSYLSFRQLETWTGMHATRLHARAGASCPFDGRPEGPALGGLLPPLETPPIVVGGVDPAVLQPWQPPTYGSTAVLNAQSSPSAGMASPLNFTLLSGTAILVDQTLYAGTMLPILLYPVLAIILLARRRHIEPAVNATA